MLFRLLLKGAMFVRLRLISYFGVLNETDGATDFDGEPNVCLFFTVLECLMLI